MADTNVRQRRRNGTEVSDRSALFSDRSSDEKTTVAAALQEAQSITSSLARTKERMKSELERMSHVSQAIDGDGKTLSNTRVTHLEMSGGIRGAKSALNVMKRKEWEDTIVLGCALLWFGLVTMYVLWCRIRIPFLLW